MFTGIVEEIATVVDVEPLAAGRRLTLRCGDAAGVKIGDSIAIDGACMTVVSTEGSTLAVDVSSESLRCTTLGDRRAGDQVNVERAMRLGERLGGHIVTGHIDGTGRIERIRPEGESAVYTFEVGADLARLLVEKGSVAVDGISLTCFNCGPDRFDAAVIPHTTQATTLGEKRPGDRINVENDLLAKYVERLLGPARTAPR